MTDLQLGATLLVRMRKRLEAERQASIPLATASFKGLMYAYPPNDFARIAPLAARGNSHSFRNGSAQPKEGALRGATTRCQGAVEG
jgi:hypothetical protein